MRLTKDVLKELINILKLIISGLLFSAILTIAIISLKKVVAVAELNTAIIIFAIVLIVALIIYLYLLERLNNLPETLNVRLDVNLNDDIILRRDERFKINIERDGEGNIIIRKG